MKKTLWAIAALTTLSTLTACGVRPETPQTAVFSPLQPAATRTGNDLPSRLTQLATIRWHLWWLSDYDPDGDDMMSWAEAIANSVPDNATGRGWFDHWDLNHDGIVAFQEFCDSGMVPDDVTFDKSFGQFMIDKMDQNGDGKLSLAEYQRNTGGFAFFIKPTTLITGAPDPQIRDHAFQKADERGDGLLDGDEGALLLAEIKAEGYIVEFDFDGPMPPPYKANSALRNGRRVTGPSSPFPSRVH